MIEYTLRDYLDDAQIPGIESNVYMEVPTEPPTEYIVIEKTGAGRTDGIDTATFAIKSISQISLERAAQINELVKEAMFEMEDNTDIYDAKLNTDYDFTNPSTKEYRYQAVFILYY